MTRNRVFQRAAGFMEPCFDAHAVLAALVNERLPFGTVPPAEVCIRLRGLSPQRLVGVCAEHGLRIIRVERRPFPDGEDTVYIVQTTLVLPDRSDFPFVSFLDSKAIPASRHPHVGWLRRHVRDAL